MPQIPNTETHPTIRRRRVLWRLCGFLRLRVALRLVAVEPFAVFCPVPRPVPPARTDALRLGAFDAPRPISFPPINARRVDTSKNLQPLLAGRKKFDAPDDEGWRFLEVSAWLSPQPDMSGPE